MKFDVPAHKFPEDYLHEIHRMVKWGKSPEVAETIDLLSKHSGLKNPLALKRYYTNEFVPAKPAM